MKKYLIALMVLASPAFAQSVPVPTPKPLTQEQTLEAQNAQLRHQLLLDEQLLNMYHVRAWQAEDNLMRMQAKDAVAQQEGKPLS